MILKSNTDLATSQLKGFTETFPYSDSAEALGVGILKSFQPRKKKLKINDFELTGVDDDNYRAFEMFLSVINKGNVTAIDLFGAEYINLLVVQHTQQ